MNFLSDKHSLLIRNRQKTQKLFDYIEKTLILAIKI